MNKTFNKVGFWFKKNAPTIMTVAGVTATVAAAGIIGYQSYKKLPKIVDDHKDGIKNIEDKSDVKAHVQVYGNTALSLVKTYALPAALLGAGITCIVGSDKIQTQRFNQVSAALGLTAAAYDELKKRVGNAIGEDKLQDILMGADPNDKKEKEFETVDAETGEIVKQKCKSYDGMATKSMYAIHFNKVNPITGSYCNPNCKGEYFYDNWFITRVEAMLNDKLKARGAGSKLWLSEIYSDLGCTASNLEITPEQELASRVVGKSYDPENPLKFNIIQRYYDKEHGTMDMWVDFIGLDGNLYDKTYDKVMNDKD